MYCVRVKNIDSNFAHHYRAFYAYELFNRFGTKSWLFLIALLPILIAHIIMCAVLCILCNSECMCDSSDILKAILANFKNENDSSDLVHGEMSKWSSFLGFLNGFSLKGPDVVVENRQKPGHEPTRNRNALQHSLKSPIKFFMAKTKESGWSGVKLAGNQR